MFRNKAKIQPGAAPSAPVELEGLGDNLAQFADDAIIPDTQQLLTHLQVWERYLGWCEARRLAPVAYPLFTEDFMVLAEDVGIDTHIRGAHIFYQECTFTPEGK